MDKIKENEKLLDYYKRNSDGTEKTKKLIVNIISAVALNKDTRNSEEFEHEILDFVNYFKEKNTEFYMQNQDYFIFRAYTEIVQKRISKKQENIENALTEKQLKIASDLVESVFDLNEAFTYTVCVDKQPYTENEATKENLRHMVECLLYFQKGVIIFHVYDEPSFCFGFHLLDNKFEEIEKKQLNGLCNRKGMTFTEFSKIKKQRRENVEKQ